MERLSGGEMSRGGGLVQVGDVGGGEGVEMSLSPLHDRAVCV